MPSARCWAGQQPELEIRQHNNNNNLVNNNKYQHTFPVIGFAMLALTSTLAVIIKAGYDTDLGTACLRLFMVVAGIAALSAFLLSEAAALRSEHRFQRPAAGR